MSVLKALFDVAMRNDIIIGAKTRNIAEILQHRNGQCVSRSTCCANFPQTRNQALTKNSSQSYLITLSSNKDDEFVKFSPPMKILVLC